MPNPLLDAIANQQPEPVVPVMDASKPDAISVPKKQDYGAVGTGLASAATEVLPTAAGFAGGSAAVGAASPLIEGATLVNPVLGAATAIGAFALGSVLPSEAARWGQNKIAEAALGQDKFAAMTADFQVNKERYPLAALVGGLGAQMPWFKPSSKGISEAYTYIKEMGASKNAAEWASKPENMEKVAQIANVGFGAALQGGQNFMDQISSGKDFKPLELATNIGLGALMNKPTEWSEWLGQKVGGKAGELLGYNLSRDRRIQAEGIKADLHSQADDFVNRFTEQAASGNMDKAGYDAMQMRAQDILQARDSSNYLDNQQRTLVENLAQQKALGTMVDAQIYDLESMRNRDISDYNRQNEELDNSTRGLDSYGRFGPSDISSGIVQPSTEYSPSQQPKYTWGQDTVRDQKKMTIARDINSLNSKLRDAIRTKQGANYKQQLADTVDQKIRDYHDIQSQTWEERLSDQDYPKKFDNEERMARNTLAGFKRKYISDSNIDSINESSDDLLLELLYKREAHSKAEAQLEIPGELERRAFQIVKSKEGMPEAQRLIDISRREKIKSEFKQQRGKLSPEAQQNLDAIVGDLKQKSQVFDTMGRRDAAKVINDTITEIYSAPTVQEKIRMLHDLTPKDPRAMALKESLDRHNLLGDKTAYENEINPSLERATADRLASERLKSETKFVDRFAGVKAISPEAKQGISEAIGKAAGSQDQFNKGATQALADLYKSGDLVGKTHEQVRSEADNYLQYKRLLELNKINDKDGFTGFKNADLQKKLAELESSQNFKAIKRYEDWAKATVEEHRGKLLEAGKIDKATADTWAANKDYIPLHADRSDFDQFKPKSKQAGKAFSSAEYLQEVQQGFRDRVSPLEALAGQRSSIERDLFNNRVYESLKNESKTNKSLASLLEFGYKPEKGAPANSYLTLDRPNGTKEYVKVKSPELARALNDLDREIMPDMLNVFGRLNRFVAEMAVHKNPLFTLTQLAYDFQAMLQNIQSTPIAGKRIELLKNWLTSFSPAVGHELRPEKMSAKTGKSAENYKLYKQFVNDGASWASAGFGSKEELAKRIMKQAEFKASDGALKGASQFLHDITHINDAIPNALRFGAYKTALEQGLSRSKAVEAAQKIMPNYQDRGTSMRAIGNYKMFVNASIQGSKRFIESTFYDKSGKLDPRGFLGFMAASLGTQALIRTTNDTKDPFWREKWNSDRNWVFVLDKTHAITIPMEWAQRPFHQMMALAVDASNGKADINKDTIGKIVAGSLEAYSPVGGGSSLGAIFAPSFAQPLMDIGSNKNFAGKPIVGKGLQNRIDKGLPPELAFYDDMNKNLLGVSSVNVARAVNSIGADATPQQIEYLFKQWFAAPSAFASGNVGQRFYREIDPDRAKQIETNSVQQRINADDEKQNAQVQKDRFEEFKKVKTIADQIAKLPFESQKEAIMQLAATDYDTAYEANQYLAHTVYAKLKASLKKPVK